MTVVKMVYSPLRLILNLLTSERCLICGADGKSWCEACFETSYEPPESRCYICNKLTKNHRTCSGCDSRLQRVWWLGEYREIVKQLIYDIKYHRKRAAGVLLGEYLAQILPYLSDNTLITFLPTASSRVRRRGFDQSRVIASVVSRSKNLQLANLLIRVGQDELVGLGRIERQKIMRGSFRVNGVALGRDIIIIDDVLTTGASLESAAKVLREAGAKHVSAAVIARRVQ